jgi:modulator of FtsH protease HflK
MSQGGGPWDTSGRGGGPWGSGPRRGGPVPPDFEEMLRRGQDRFRRILPGGFRTGSGLALVVAAIFVMWMASGFYRVLPDEVGVVLRFGAFNRITQPGLNYHLPNPIESVLVPAVTRVNRTEIGYRTTETRRGPAHQDVPQESLMLTGDENIVDINFAVFWIINDARKYLFDIRDPGLTVKSAAESAMREVIGEIPIASALAEGRGKIETETRSLLQHLLDNYRSGITVTQVQLQRVDPPGPVIDAFRDVQRALADRARLRNEAESYRNGIVPRARGDAVRIVQEAEAYRQQVVAHAQGEAARFDSVYNAFKVAPDVTQRRIYLDTLEEILKNADKVIIDKSALGGSGIVPYLPLPALPGAAAPHAPSNSAPPPSAGQR